MVANQRFRRVILHHKIRSLILSAGVILGLVGCTKLNNPFWPAAEVSILQVKGSKGFLAPVGTALGAGVLTVPLIGIEQSVGVSPGDASGKKVIYTYNEPVVTVRNSPFGPGVSFYKYAVSYSLADGTKLPTKEYPLFRNLRAGVRPPLGAQPPEQPDGSLVVDIELQVLSSDSDLRAVVFPGNSAPRVSDGVANIALFGKDDNGYQVELNFVVPLSFNSLAFADGQPLEEPEASPTPEASEDLNDLVSGLNQNT